MGANNGEVPKISIDRVLKSAGPIEQIGRGPTKLRVDDG